MTDKRLREALSWIVAQYDEWGDVEPVHIEHARKALAETEQPDRCPRCGSKKIQGILPSGEKHCMACHHEWNALAETSTPTPKCGQSEAEEWRQPDESTPDPIAAIINEYNRAIKKFPLFPANIVQQLAVMNEEAGEAVKAANEHYWEGRPIRAVEMELIQTGAMVLRCLLHLHECRVTDEERNSQVRSVPIENQGLPPDDWRPE